MLQFSFSFFPSVGFQVYAVCTSVKELCTRIPRMTGEEKEFETIERGRRKHTLSVALIIQ